MNVKNELDVAGSEGGKDGAGCDKEMEKLIQFADEDEEQKFEVKNEDGDEDKSPKKRRRSV